MTDEEQQIVTFLNSSPETYFARKEIARRAVRREVYEENQHWVDAPLSSLVMQGIIEKNDSGQYRVKKDEELR
jgi:hypothetical protein